MNLIEKEKIRYWRGEGLGYKAVAAKAGLTENAVKGFCKRNGLDGEAIKSPCEFCRHCGKAIEQRPKCKPRKFCCDACRRAWWNAHPYLAEKSADYQLACACCGRRFVSYGKIKKS